MSVTVYDVNCYILQLVTVILCELYFTICDDELLSFVINDSDMIFVFFALRGKNTYYLFLGVVSDNDQYAVFSILLLTSALITVS